MFCYCFSLFTIRESRGFEDRGGMLVAQCRWRHSLRQDHFDDVAIWRQRYYKIRTYANLLRNYL